MKYWLVSLIIIFELGIVTNIYGQSLGQNWYPARPIPDRIILNLTETPANSMAFNWRTSTTVDEGYVQIQIASANPKMGLGLRELKAQREFLGNEVDSAHYFSVEVEDLLPETQYAYRVGKKEFWSEWAHFTTASHSKKEEASFIYFGDAQNNVKSLWSRAIRGAFTKMPEADFMIHAGDLINRANNDLEWGEWFYAGGWINQMIPSLATPGNHEYEMVDKKKWSLSKHWQPSFNLPQNGPIGFKESVYYVDYQNVRIISLNTMAFTVSKVAARLQTEWLEEVLMTNHQKWTILMMHHPVYSSTTGRDNEQLSKALVPLLEKYRVDLVLQGHDHSYGRGSMEVMASSSDQIKGPIYVVSVSGPKMYRSGLGEWMQRGAANLQLYQLITVKENVLHFEAYTVTGTVYDAFELVKGRKSNTFVDLAPKDVKEELQLPPRFKERSSSETLDSYRQRFKAYKERNKREDKRSRQ